jgi:hypothetical protein|tara:strand:- start:8753 stop:9076 length:324 start_codon:yes stop_codon:yes gene_type:complete
MNKDIYEIIKDVDSVLAEVMIGDYAHKKRYDRVLGRRTRKESKSDAYLRLCDKCNFVWEKEFSSWRTTNKTKYKYICKFEEIPRYGKPVETCLICLGEPNVKVKRIY